MKHYLPTLSIICLLLLSCNNSANTTNTDNNPSITDGNFLGTWVFSNEVPVASNRDNTMNGTTCAISKVPGTKESYSVDILKTTDILFTKQNDSTLKGVSSDFIIRYKTSDQHIIYQFNSNSKDGIEYYRLK